MKNRKPYFRILTVLLCVFLLVSLAACGATDDPSSGPADSSGDMTPETPKTNADKLLDAFGAYDTYFHDISDTFGTKLPAVSDHGTMDFWMTIPEFSVFGENRADVFDPEQPVMQATAVLAGDFASLALSTLLYGEQMRIEIYESATEGIMVFPDLADQAPIRVAAEDAENGITSAEDAFRKQLDALEDASENDVAYLAVAEDGDTCTYTLRLTEKQVEELMTDLGLDPSTLIDDTKPTTEENHMLLELTTEKGVPTELHITLNNEGETEAAVNFLLKTSVTGSNTKISAELSAKGEMVATVNAAITSAQGVITVNAALEMNEIKLTANVKLLSESENSITLDGTAEARFTTEGDAAINLPLNVTGKIRAEGGARETELDLRSSSTSMFDITLHIESRFTPGETSVTMPNGAVDADQVDYNTLLEALMEAYPLTFGGYNSYVDGWSYLSEDMYVIATVYEDDILELSAWVYCIDDGKTLTFSYDGETMWSYAYTKNADGSINCHGIDLLSEPEAEEYGCEKILYCESEGYDIWLEIDFYEDGIAELYLCLPFETIDGVTKILLPDGTALPFDVVLPESETSTMKIGSLTLLPYESLDIV